LSLEIKKSRGHLRGSMGPRKSRGL
jgi:hypothetical protein